MTRGQRFTVDRTGQIGTAVDKGQQGAGEHSNGRIGLTVRLGVTGHRNLDDEDALARRVSAELDRLPAVAGLRSSPTTPLSYVVVSALADGADRLVVREVMKRPGARLEVILPFSHEKYRRDFDQHSGRDFDALLSSAATVRCPGPHTGQDPGYAPAGRAIVDESDVLIALWDGAAARGPGGTAEVIEYAKRRGVPRIIIWTVDRHQPAEGVGGSEGQPPIGSQLSEAAFRHLDGYNRKSVDSRQFESEMRAQIAALRPDSHAIHPDRLPFDRVAEWVMPYFVRADLLAARHHQADERCGFFLFSLAAVAVVAVALQSQLFRDTREIVFIELAALFVLAVVLRVRLPLRLHVRWITYRYLAEQLRSAMFLVMAGADLPGSRTRLRGAGQLGGSDALDEDPSEEWVRRALEEVSSQRPLDEGTTPDCRDLRRYLADKWIEQQAGYYRDASESHRKQHERLTHGIWLLLALSIVVASLHIAGLGEGGPEGEHRLGELLVFLSISLPACGAALGGLRELRDHRRHAERYGRTVRILLSKAAKMRAANDREAIAMVAMEAARVMRDEGSDWFTVVRFEELDAL